MGNLLTKNVVMKSAIGQFQNMGSSKDKWPGFCFWFYFFDK